MKMKLQAELVFIRMVSPLDRGTIELGNGLLTIKPLRRSTISLNI